MTSVQLIIKYTLNLSFQSDMKGKKMFAKHFLLTKLMSRFRTRLHIIQQSIHSECPKYY